MPRPNIYQKHGAGYGNFVNDLPLTNGQSGHWYNRLGRHVPQQPTMPLTNTYFQPTGINSGVMMEF